LQTAAAAASPAGIGGLQHSHVQKLHLKQLTALLLLHAGRSSSNCHELMPKPNQTQLATHPAAPCYYPLAQETQTQLLHPAATAAAAAWH
jgi:hypothetical protein